MILLQAFRQFPVASTVVASSAVAVVSAPILKREHRDGLHGRSVVVLSSLSAIYGAATCYWIAQQLPHLRDAVKSLDAVTAVQRLRNCAFLGMIGGGPASRLGSTAHGLRKGDPEAKQWQYWFGRRVLPLWNAETAAWLSEWIGDAAYGALNDEGLHDVLVYRLVDVIKSPDTGLSKMEQLFRRLDKQHVLNAYRREVRIPRCPDLQQMDDDLVRLELGPVVGRTDLHDLHCDLNTRFARLREYVRKSPSVLPEARAWLDGSGKWLEKRGEYYRSIYSPPADEESASASDACFGFMQGDLEPWRIAFGLETFDQEEMQRKLEAYGIRTEDEFQEKVVRQITGVVTNDAVREKVAELLQCEAPPPAPAEAVAAPAAPAPERSPSLLKVPVYLAVWGLVTASMVQQSWKLFAVGVAAGLGERLIKGRETTSTEFRLMQRFRGLPFLAEAVFTDRTGGRDIATRARTWSGLSLVGELLMPELQQASLVMLGMNLPTIALALGIVQGCQNPSMIRDLSLLSSVFAGRVFLHTVAGSLPTRSQARG